MLPSTCYTGKAYGSPALSNSLLLYGDGHKADTALRNRALIVRRYTEKYFTAEQTWRVEGGLPISFKFRTKVKTS